MKFFTRLLFKYQLSKGKLIKVGEKHRGIGKTTMLIKRAIKHDMTILVGSQRHIDYIKSLNPDVKVLGFAPNFTKHVYNGYFPNGVLLDESVDQEIAMYLWRAYPMSIEIKGGFRNK